MRYSDRSLFILSSLPKRRDSQLRRKNSSPMKVERLLGKEGVNAERREIHVGSGLTLFFKNPCDFVNHCIPSIQHTLGKQYFAE